MQPFTLRPATGSLALPLLRSFNAAAFIALAFFYFGMFCLGPPTLNEINLIPLQAPAARQP